jgi:uncharacterized protein YlaN (UPF0358 family)
MPSKHRDERLHRKAVEEVRHAYQIADAMREVDLAAINDPRPPTLRYHAQYELVMEFVNRAGAMLDFAGKLDLIDSDEAKAILQEVGKDHPELDKWLADEDKRLSKEQ